MAPYDGRSAAPARPAAATARRRSGRGGPPDKAPPGLDEIAASPSKGRGAIGNPTGRFEPAERVEVADGWDEDRDRPSTVTSVTLERTRTLITRNDSPDIGFDRSINPYRGCEHGCIYCFARPNHSYVGLSPGVDFETRLFVKEGAAERLERELAAPSYRPRPIAIGTSTDPYQPIERQHRVMRGVLEVLARANHPLGIVTKSALVTRDIDLLAPMAAKGLAKVGISVTTLDGALARRMEPRAPSPEKRLAAIEALSRAGIPTMVMVAPLIPAINDAEIEAILERARAAGASEASYVVLRLPLEVRDLFREWLLHHFPDRLRHVMGLVQEMRGGKDYDSAWGKRMSGEGPYATMLGRRFEIACRTHGFAKQRTRLRTDLFRPPARAGAQLDLFA